MSCNDAMTVHNETEGGEGGALSDCVDCVQSAMQGPGLVALLALPPFLFLPLSAVRLLVCGSAGSASLGLGAWQ